MQVGEEKEEVYTEELSVGMVFKKGGGWQLRRHKRYPLSIVNGDPTLCALLLLVERMHIETRNSF